MLDQTLTLPEASEELRSFTARLLAEVKAQAILIEKLRHQLAGHRAHRFGASSETAEHLQRALETNEIAAAAKTARLRLPRIEELDKPKRRPIPDHIPRMEVALTPIADARSRYSAVLSVSGDITRRLNRSLRFDLMAFRWTKGTTRSDPHPYRLCWSCRRSPLGVQRLIAEFDSLAFC